MIQVIGLVNKIIGTEGAKWLADAITTNSTLQNIDISSNRVGVNLDSKIAELLKEKRSQKIRHACEYICSFTEGKKDLIRLRFYKMILRFLFFPCKTKKLKFLWSQIR
jgi:Ran GTPase-activating protein (RanGAP) involved in mRNA processing and transport